MNIGTKQIGIKKFAGSGEGREMFKRFYDKYLV